MTCALVDGQRRSGADTRGPGNGRRHPGGTVSGHPVERAQGSPEQAGLGGHLTTGWVRPGGPSDQDKALSRRQVSGVGVAKELPSTRPASQSALSAITDRTTGDLPWCACCQEPEPVAGGRLSMEMEKGVVGLIGSTGLLLLAFSAHLAAQGGARTQRVIAIVGAICFGLLAVLGFLDSPRVAWWDAVVLASLTIAPLTLSLVALFAPRKGG